MSLKRFVRLPMRERFDLSYCANPMSGCWIWMGGLRNGYGLIKERGVKHYAHRLSWRIYFGEIPPNAEVCHRCDVKACVNPAHLFVGSHRDNMLDAWRKQIVKKPPSRRGTSHAMAKLTEEQVLVIRARRSSGETVRAIARDYAVTPACVAYAARGDTWTHLE